MTKKAEFNADEWEKVVEAPPIAGMLVVTAERGGTIRESLEIGKVYREARQAHMGPELVDEVLESAPEVDPQGYSGPEDLHRRGHETLREAIAILEAKATADEVDSYRGFVMGIAERVAHAHKSGGLFGIGGHEVSENEQVALDEIRQTIGAHEVPDPGEEE